MDRKKIQELAGKIKALAGTPGGVDQMTALEIVQAAIQIDNETRRTRHASALVV